MIELREVKKVYGSGEQETQALRGVNLSIAEGELVAIMGTSGSGKSTLLHLVGGLDCVTSGELIFRGEDISKYDRRRLHEYRKKNISFVFQNFELIPDYTVYQNVEIPLLARKIRNRKERIFRCLKEMQIEDLAQKKVTQISGGQQQRCAIARALVADTSVLLADEPTGALDKGTSGEIMDVLQRVNRDNKKTIIIVTHDPEVAKACDRILMLEDGKIVEQINE